MKIDQDILFEFLPEEDKKFFILWVNMIVSNGKYIVATYKLTCGSYPPGIQYNIIIAKSEYKSMIRQKNIDKILI
jgi:hypothetical protein